MASADQGRCDTGSLLDGVLDRSVSGLELPTAREWQVWWRKSAGAAYLGPGRYDNPFVMVASSERAVVVTAAMGMQSKSAAMRPRPY